MGALDPTLGTGTCGCGCLQGSCRPPATEWAPRSIQMAVVQRWFPRPFSSSEPAFPERLLCARNSPLVIHLALKIALKGPGVVAQS